MSEGLVRGQDEGTVLLTGSGGLYTNCYPACDPASSKLCNSRLTWVIS